MSNTYIWRIEETFDIEEEMDKVQVELQDRERRRNTVVIFGLVESVSKEAPKII
jgi:hypothetical protein